MARNTKIIMREIKFRGKSEIFNEWLYGNLVVSDTGTCCICSPQDMEMDGHHIRQLADKPLYVNKETLGQYTGLKDKNGKEIYEGDIVECVSWNEYFSKDGMLEPFRRKMFVDFRKGGFKMIEPMPEPMKDNEWDIIYNGDIEVIGNIWDNPELLEKK